MTEEIHVLNCGKYWTVCNRLSCAEPKNHSHFWVKKAAYTLKSLIDDKIIPYSPYLIESALRVSVDEVYKERIIKEYNIPEKLNVFSEEAKFIIESALKESNIGGY